jgi:hypothetical protein
MHDRLESFCNLIVEIMNQQTSPVKSPSTHEQDILLVKLPGA